MVHQQQQHATAVDKDGSVRSSASDYHAHEEETHTKQTNDDGMGDAAALLVMLYLLFVSTLLVGALVIGFFLVIQYGFVVLVAVCTAVFGLLIVGATVTSMITRDAKLRKARGKIKRCVHVVVLVYACTYAHCICLYVVLTICTCKHTKQLACHL